MSPHEIDAQQVEQLDSGFTHFVDILLDAERAKQSMAAHTLNYDSNENAADGGVDATVRDAPPSSPDQWIPEGNSAWQFKKGDLTPANCAQELEGAEWAHTTLSEGGSYILALGKRLGDRKIQSRQNALQSKAIELGLITEQERSRVKVYDANLLARWASQFTGLIRDPIFNARLGPLRAFDVWTQSRTHQHIWVDDEARTNQKREVLEFLNDPQKKELRVEGPGGIGKTRFVMEALRNSGFNRLVAYAPDEDELTVETLNWLVNKKTILVVDECGRREHDKIWEKLSVNSDIWLISIGKEDPYSSTVAVLAPSLMSPDDISKVLTQNFPLLWPEARHFVSEKCDGFVRMAYVLATKLQERGEAQAAELIERGDVESILSITLPEGHDFLLMAMLAIFDRIGWDGEVASELELLAEFGGVTTSELRRVGGELQKQGLLEKQGRYRAISPQPLAVYLAADYWKTEAQRIVDDLMPRLSKTMLKALFVRVAELGRFEPASEVLESLLAPGGSFDSLDDIESNDLGELLIQLAIVVPEPAIRHLGRLIDQSTIDELRARHQLRRNLVWALEKIAWHTKTFRQAAKALLKLSLAENESYSNNATGTWLNLFGAVLPATAAKTTVRTQYLNEMAADQDKDIRLLVVKACQRALARDESVIASAELQGGATVEPRGRPASNDEYNDYRNNAVLILGRLVHDKNEEVSSVAAKALIDMLYISLDDLGIMPTYQEIMLKLPERYIIGIHSEVGRIEGFLDRRSNENLLKALKSFSAKLPKLSSVDELKSIGNLNSWELEQDSSQLRIQELVQSIQKSPGVQAIVQWLKQEPINSAWMIGRALGRLERDSDATLELLAGATEKNSSALAGFLEARSISGNKEAFIEFADSEIGKKLSDGLRLYLITRGKPTKKATIRAIELAKNLPPRQAAVNLLPWMQEVTINDVTTLIKNWLERLDDAKDYQAVLDWVHGWVRKQTDLPDDFLKLLWELLVLRKKFFELIQSDWEWCQLAKMFVVTKSGDIANLVVDAVSDGALMLSHSEESQVLVECIKQDPDAVWAAVIKGMVQDKPWRVALNLQGWLVREFPVSTITNWVGTSLERARLVARISHPGFQKPSPIGKFLLDNFEDEKIKQTLSAQYGTDGWSGSWSSHIALRLSELQKWVDDPAESPRVKDWALNMIGSLQYQQRIAIQDEQERRF